MYSRSIFIVLCVLLLSRHAMSAAVKVKSVPDSENGAAHESTTQTGLSSSPARDDPSADIITLHSRSNRNNRIETYGTGADTSNIDWREDESLRLESMREAGFQRGSFEEEE